MKTIYYTHQGDAKSCSKIGHLPKIESKSNQVKVKVTALDVNSSDIKNSNFSGHSPR